MKKSSPEAYRALMEDVKNPTSVREAILAEADVLRAKAAPTRASRPHKRPTAPPLVPRWRLPLVLTACLCAALLVVGTIPLLPQGRSSVDPSSLSFSVQAYASNAKAPIPPSDNGMIVFDRKGGIVTATKDWYLEEGAYTGCAFTVQGDDIVRVQATTSLGVLYRITYDTVSPDDEPERYEELSRWKPEKRGLGTYYKDYESVEIIDGFGVDPYALTVRMTKLYGSTVDVLLDHAQGDEAATFGLWTDEDYGDVEDNANDPFATGGAIIDLFDGETIAVTAYFEDGSCATQTIELHAADLKAELGGDYAIYTGNLTVYPEIVDRNSLPNAVTVQSGPCYLHSLYGVVVSETSEPHPYPLEGANEHAGTVIPYVFERQEQLQWLEGTTLDAENVHDPDERVTVSSTTETRERTQPFELSNLRISAGGSTLPLGLSIADTTVYTGHRGDMEYANKVSEETRGYRINDDGSLTTGVSYWTITIDVTNTSTDESTFGLFSFGTIGVREESSGNFALGLGGPIWWTDYHADHSSSLPFAAGETRELTLVGIVSDEAYDYEDPIIVVSAPNPDEVGQPYIAYRIKSLL